jgi:hypothetical protein
MPRRDLFAVNSGAAAQTAPPAGSTAPCPAAQRPADVGWDAVPRTAAMPVVLRPTWF